MSAAEKALALLNGLRDAVTNLPVRGADPRLAKAFLRVSDCIFELEQWCMESTALEDRALIAACAPYLKDGETPAECIARNRADIDSVLTLLAQAKQSVQHLATCATNGHVYGHAGACIFCGEPKSTPVEPAGAAPEGREHPMTERAKKVATLEITLRARYDVQTGRMVGLGVETPNAQGWHPRVTGSYMSTADRVFPAKLPRAAARIAKKG